MASTTKTPSTAKPPSKHHYVRLSGPPGMRVYATNLVLRELAPLLIQDSVTEALQKSGRRGPMTFRFSAGRGKAFTVRVNPERGETHLQMSSEH